jgi:endoglucanase
MRLRFAIPLALICCAGAADTFIDLAPVATTSRMDDGIADNGAGGWTDEGINDLFLYPPVPSGDVVRNGHPFRILDAGSNGGRDVVLLKGERRATTMPASVDVPVAKLSCRYLYFLHHAVAEVPGQGAGAVIATYTIRYADGTSVAADMRNGIEMHQWWCNDWFHNHGAEAWPIFMGRNPYALKWKKLIGVWATRWRNPHPETAITAITLASAGKAAPAIWAITASDRDYHEANPELKKDYVRVPDAPAGFFADRLRIERLAIYQAAKAEGVLKGLLRVEAIRRDLLAITVDSAFGRIGSGDGSDVLPALQQAESFSIRGADGALVTPTAVGRQTVEAWRGDVASFPANVFMHHTFYLRLPGSGLEPGRAYDIRVGHIDAELQSTVSFTWDPRSSASPAIKVNQVGYAAAAKARSAYLGWWAGDLGTIAFDDCTTFQVVSAADGAVVHEGGIVLAASDPLSGERPGRMDLAAVGPGRYRIIVPGVGASFPFRIGEGAERELAFHTQRAFFHQRAGFELTKEFTDFPRPASHLDVYESGYMVGNRSYTPRPGEPVRRFRGGYHDAGDDDVFTYHLRATAQVLHVYALHPEAFADGDLKLPESGNGIPDILDEATWALSFFIEQQQPDGAIPLGRGHDQDYIREYERKNGKRPPFGILPPRNTSASEFAAVAALYARLIRRFDAVAADRHLAAAERALAWSLARPIAENEDRGDALFRLWAAAELLAASGAPAHARTFADLVAAGHLARSHWSLAWMQGMVEWAYLRADPSATDAALRKQMQARFLKRADEWAAALAAHPYAMSWSGKGDLGWGNGNGGGHYGYFLALAHALGGDQRHLDAASQNADFQLGANPLSRCFITGLGHRPPLNPQLNPLLYSRPKKTGTTVPGIAIYGLSGRSPETAISTWHPQNVPILRAYRDMSGGVEACSEFTITETIGVAAALYGYLDAVGRGAKR